MVTERRGINLSGRLIGPMRMAVASWSTPERKLLPLALSIQLPANGAFNLAFPGFLPRARVTWGHEDADQWVEFDLCSCTIVKLASSMSLELWLYPELRSLFVANTLPAPQALTQGCSVLIGVAPSGMQANRKLTLTEYIQDIPANLYLSVVPNWARGISIWEGRPAGAPVTAPPTYIGGIDIVRADATMARAFYHIPIDECWRKFAPLGPGVMAGNIVNWTGQMASTGAPEVQACFEIEV